MDAARSVSNIATSGAPSAKKAELIAQLIREAGAYCWVGIYEVSQGDIVIVGWSGPGAPAHPRFPVEHGLCGAAVASREPVIVDDVSADPRYLTTFGSTRSELVIPVSDDRARVLGVIDVESDRRGAFGPEDIRLVTKLAAAAIPLWHEQTEESRV